jgi:Putative DNA-binding domain
MAFFHRAIGELGPDDINRIVVDQEPEGADLEFKREVELDAAGRVRDSSRNDIAREIVAFANADGGSLIIGIEESEDQPKRASVTRPVASCHDLAERLRRAVIEIIEPKLPLLHSRAIELQNGAGVIVFIVPHSRRAPHRVEPLRDCFRRTGSESRKMSMREIQELTLAIANESDRTDRRFAELGATAERFYDQVRQHWQRRPERGLPADQCYLRMSAVPLSRIWLNRVVGRPELKPVMPTVRFNSMGRSATADYPWGRNSRTARPIVRGERRSGIWDERACLDEIYCDGAVTIGFVGTGARIFSAWILSQLAALVLTIDTLRRAAGAAEAEYAVEVALHTTGRIGLGFGNDNLFSDAGACFEPGGAAFPRYSYGSTDGRLTLIGEIMQDIVHSSGFADSVEWNLHIEG